MDCQKDQVQNNGNHKNPTCNCRFLKRICFKSQMLRLTPKLPWTPKVPHKCWTTVCLSKLPLRFAPWSLVFQIIAGFGFPIGYNGEFEIFKEKVKKWEIQKFNFPKSFCEDHREEISGQVWKLLAKICSRNSLFHSLWGPTLTKTIFKITKKNPNVVL